ncbi:MAG: hypothetical protein HZB59_05845 [Ignavibacteriales bacterium]|nr:hypothetical protein [Ignavibacteriales bacterium]
MKTEVTNKRPFIRAIWIIMALVLIFYGSTSIIQGKINYLNYWGGLVFAPIVTLVGVFLLFMIIFRWNQFNKWGSEKSNADKFR